MSTSSRVDGVRRSQKRLAVPKEDVLQYVLRTVLLDHSIKTRPKFLAHSNTSVNGNPETKYAKAQTTYKGASVSSISSIAEILSNGGIGAKDKKTSKFPKELIKLLETALKRVFMRQDPAFEDALIRSTFGIFYGYYTTESFQKTVKDNRKIEDLILMFFSKATGELQKRLPDEEVKHVVNQHVARFVRLILQVVRTNRLVSSDSELISKLSDYEAKLLLNSQMLAPTPPTMENNTKPTESPTPKVSQIPTLQFLRSIFRFEETSMQNLVESLYKKCTDESALRDLKLQVEYVHTQSGSSYKVGDFDSEEDYATWKQNEISELTKAILKITNSNPSLAGVSSARPETLKREGLLRSRSSSSISEASELPRRISSLSLTNYSAHEGSSTVTSLFYQPMEASMFYRELLSICLDHDLSQNHAKTSEGEDDTRNTLLSKSSNDLLNQCRFRWRVMHESHKVILIDLCRARFVDNKMDLVLLDEAFIEIKSEGDLEFRKCTLHDQMIWKKALLSLNESLFRDLYAELQQAYTARIDVRILTVLDDHIYSDALFQEAAPETAHMFDELEEGVQQAALDYYTQCCKDVLDPESLQVLHIINLGTTLFAGVQKFRKRYKQLILDVINLWQIYLQTVLPAYLNDLKGRMEQAYRQVQSQNLDFSTEDMFELYRVIFQIHDCLEQFYPSYKSPINMDQYFRPFVFRWLDNANASILELVPRVIDADDFSLADEAESNEGARSQSVVLLLRSMNQHLSYLRELEWPDEYWAAKFATTLSKTFSEAIKEYCIKLEKLFADEMVISPQSTDQSEISHVSLQQRLINRAREAVAKKEPIEPFHISSSACVKLNNIEWSKLNLDKLENNLDSAALAQVIERYEGAKEPWKQGERTIFTIKVVSAENLVPCDSNGFSDPYVVLSDQKGKRIGKTRTIYTNLNPQWDESFDVSTTEPLWLAATVWDRDPTGEHDICGRCYFKLDPRFFDDFQPKDFHINLDTQGILHLRITMEGETDDSSYYFARAFRFLNRAESDMSRSIVDKMTPFISTSLSRETLKTIYSKPLTIDNTIDSAYNLLNKAGFANTRTANPRHSIPLTSQEMEQAIDPLLQYLDNNFRVLDTALSRSAFIMVMTKLWNFIVTIIEDLIVPPLLTPAEKIKRPLRENELDVVYKWLAFLKDTFAGDGGGLSEEELQTPQYHELLSIRFFYFDEVDELMRECDRMAATSIMRKEEQLRKGSVYRKAYNLGTMKQNRDERRARRRELSNSEDIILRVLRLRGSQDAQHFISARLEQKNQESRRAVTDAGMTRQSTVPSRHFNRRVSGIRS